MRIIVRHWHEYPVNQASPKWERPFWYAICFIIDNTILRHVYAEELEMTEKNDDTN